MLENINTQGWLTHCPVCFGRRCPKERGLQEHEVTNSMSNLLTNKDGQIQALIFL